MKKGTATGLLITAVFCLLWVGCGRKTPVKEQKGDYGAGDTVYFPVVETGNPALDDGVNKEIKKRLTENYKAVKGERKGRTTEGFTSFENGDLISVFQEGAFEEEGKGETESYVYIMHINKRNGRFYGLDDLFKDGYEDRLTERVTEVLDLNLGEYNLSYRPDIKNTPFDIYEKELVFIFNPCSIAPKNVGFVDAGLPFEQIDDLIDKNGEFYSVICDDKS